MADATAPAAAATGAMGLGGAAAQMAVGLILILAVILLAYWMLRRFGPRMGFGRGANAHGLRFEGQLPLGPKRSIMVVRFLNKLLVLGVTDQSINLLTQVDHPDEGQDFKTALDAARAAPGRASDASDTDPGPGGPGPS